MATISITIPDAKLAKVIDALCAIPPPWSATLPDGSPNPETRPQFAKRRVAQFIRDAYHSKQRSDWLLEAHSNPVDDLSGIE